MPYARADRRFTEGDCEGIAAMARMIFAMSFLRVSTLDVHSAETSKWFSDFVNISPDKFINEAINKFAKVCGSHAINVLLPDEGAVGRYKIPSVTGCNTFGIDVAVFNATKKRDAETGKLSGFEVPKMPSHPTIIVDDICDGGGTFTGIAEQLTDISELALYTTHGIYSKGLDPLKKWFKYLYTTNSFRTAADYQDMYKFDPSLTVMNCLPEFDF
jgi:ribose-phosphate pyrophosphokinase